MGNWFFEDIWIDRLLIEDSDYGVWGLNSLHKSRLKLKAPTCRSRYSNKEIGSLSKLKLERNCLSI